MNVGKRKNALKRLETQSNANARNKRKNITREEHLDEVNRKLLLEIEQYKATEAISKKTTKDLVAIEKETGIECVKIQKGLVNDGVLNCRRLTKDLATRTTEVANLRNTVRIDNEKMANLQELFNEAVKEVASVKQLLSQKKISCIIDEDKAYEERVLKMKHEEKMLNLRVEKERVLMVREENRKASASIVSENNLTAKREFLDYKTSLQAGVKTLTKNERAFPRLARLLMRRND